MGLARLVEGGGGTDRATYAANFRQFIKNLLKIA